jgi:hypothetical protein
LHEACCGSPSCNSRLDGGDLGSQGAVSQAGRHTGMTCLTTVHAQAPAAAFSSSTSSSGLRSQLASAEARLHRHASRARTPRSPLRTAGSQAQPQPGPHCLTRVTAREFLVVSAVSATANTHRHAMHSRTRATPILDNSRNAQRATRFHESNTRE